MTFVVDETMPAWPRIAELVVELGALDIVTTEFTKQEAEQARWVR